MLESTLSPSQGLWIWPLASLQFWKSVGGNPQGMPIRDSNLSMQQADALLPELYAASIRGTSKLSYFCWYSADLKAFLAASMRGVRREVGEAMLTIAPFRNRHSTSYTHKQSMDTKAKRVAGDQGHRSGQPIFG